MTSSLIIALTTLGTTAMLCLAALKGWRGWLDLRRYQIAAGRSMAEAPEASSGVRIEMADLKERVRKLEAIATGVDP